jgi:2-octaprenylphenol hydroxylase
VDHDLIIVGGGPVGAAMARAARALSVALVAHEPRVPQPREPRRFDARVYAISPGNMAFLRDLERLPEERLTPVHAMSVFGDSGSHIEFDAYRAGVPALAWIVEDAVLQDAFWHGLEPEVARCDRIKIGKNQAIVELEGGKEIAAKLVVGADGANSFVRAQAGIGAKEKAYGQSAVVANFACERAHANVAYQWFQGGPVLALLPLAGNHVSMVWSLPAEDAARVEALDALALCREVERATRGALGQLELVTPARSYALRRVSSHRMVQPRVALVGDAAHVIHPLAGQGLNLGLQDVRALSQALQSRESWRDPGDWRVLRRYERSRAEPILAMNAMVDGLFRLFGAQGGVAAGLRNRGLNLTDRLPVLKNLLIRQAMN